ncbi:unnamed protein product [Ixodes pacificus]
MPEWFFSCVNHSMVLRAFHLNISRQIPQREGFSPTCRDAIGLRVITVERTQWTLVLVFQILPLHVRPIFLEGPCQSASHSQCSPLCCQSLL